MNSANIIVLHLTNISQPLTYVQYPRDAVIRKINKVFVLTELKFYGETVNKHK